MVSSRRHIELNWIDLDWIELVFTNQQVIVWSGNILVKTCTAQRQLVMGVERGYKTISIAEYFTFLLERYQLAWASVITNYSLPDMTPSVNHFLEFSTPISWEGDLLSPPIHLVTPHLKRYISISYSKYGAETQKFEVHTTQFIMHNAVSPNIPIACCRWSWFRHLCSTHVMNLRWWEWTSRNTPKHCSQLSITPQAQAPDNSQWSESSSHHQADHTYPRHCNMTHHLTCHSHLSYQRHPQCPLHQGMGAGSCISGRHDHMTMVTTETLIS